MPLRCRTRRLPWSEQERSAGTTPPGWIQQTGTHRRIVFGEIPDTVGSALGPVRRSIGDGGARTSAEPSPRVLALAEQFRRADVQAEPVADARVPLWEKFIYLAPF